jgi:hypothetical protein
MSIGDPSRRKPTKEELEGFFDELEEMVEKGQLHWWMNKEQKRRCYQAKAKIKEVAQKITEEREERKELYWKNKRLSSRR